MLVHFISFDSNPGKICHSHKCVRNTNKPNIKIIGLGDSPNDLPLLLNSDFRIVIPSPSGPNIKLLNKLKNYKFILASEPNGLGWKNEINKLINKLAITKQ